MEDRRLFTRGVFPRGSTEGRSELQAECLIEGLDPEIEVTVRLLQAVERQVLDARGEPVEHLTVTGRRYAGGEETVEHEIRIPSLPGRTAAIETAGSRRADLVENGAPAGALAWHWGPLHATVEAWVEELGQDLRRVRVSVANRLERDGGAAEQPPRRAFYSTEVTMHSTDGAFASLADPPPHLREQSMTCRNEGLWPVPVGEAGDRRTMLASQIRLEDYPHAIRQSRNIPFGRNARPGRHGTDGIRSAA